MLCRVPTAVRRAKGGREKKSGVPSPRARERDSEPQQLTSVTLASLNVALSWFFPHTEKILLMFSPASSHLASAAFSRSSKKLAWCARGGRASGRPILAVFFGTFW